MVRICFLSIVCSAVSRIVAGVEHSIVIDIEGSCDEDVVDAPQFPTYRAVVVCIEAWACTIGDELLLGADIGVVKESRVEEQFVSFSCLYSVVVARYDDGYRYFLLQHPFGP